MPWEEIKKYWREKFGLHEVYVDDDDHVISFNKDNSTVIIGYLHFGNIKISEYHCNDFIKDIREFGEKNYDSFKIYLICNRRLSNMRTVKEVLALPSDVEYYFVDYNSFHETISFKLEDKNDAAKNVKPETPIWYRRQGIKVIEDSRFEDWKKWATQKFEREWYDWNDLEKFEDNWGLWTGSRNIVTDIYIDERLLGFYLVWKYVENNE